MVQLSQAGRQADVVHVLLVIFTVENPSELNVRIDYEKA